MILDIAKKRHSKQERVKERTKERKKCYLQNEARNTRREEGNKLEIKKYP
jgi:hypothetical protein